VFIIIGQPSTKSSLVLITNTQIQFKLAVLVLLYSLDQTLLLTSCRSQVVAAHPDALNEIVAAL